MRRLLLFALLLAPLHAAELPNFPLQDLSGKARYVSELMTPGKPLVLVYWCSTCHSCRDAEAQIDGLREKVGNRAAIFLVDANRGETEAQVRRVLEAKGLKLSVVRDPKGQLADHFGIKLTTSTVILDSGREVRYLGSFAAAPAALEQLLGGQPVEPSRTRFAGCPIRR